MRPPRFHIQHLMVLVAAAALLTLMAQNRPIPALGICLGIGTRLTWRAFVEAPYLARKPTPTEEDLRTVQRAGIATAAGVTAFVMIGGLVWEVLH
ncbi:MAG TPA: hypothetical protein VF590_14665 [Isosphaeraceae bacterium]